MQLHLRLKSGEEWVRPTSCATLFDVLARLTSSGLKYRLMGGNTGTG